MLKFHLKLSLFFSPALETRARGRADYRAHFIELSLDLAAVDLLIVCFIRELSVVLGPPGEPGCQAGHALLVLDVLGHVVDAHLDWTLVSGAAEAGDDLLSAAGYRWWTALLEADDVSSEAETEVARVVPRNLLGRHVDLVLKETGARSNAVNVNIGVVFLIRLVILPDQRTGGDCRLDSFPIQSCCQKTC